jgi:hypothetical protein
VSGIDDRFVSLRGGLVVPVEPYLLILDLERRGIPVSVEAGDLMVGPGRDLTDEDRTTIRRWKRHLVMLVNYCTDPATSAHLFTDAAAADAADDWETVA